MSRFIKLTNIVINSCKIITINHTGSKYYVQTCAHALPYGMFFFGSGFLETVNSNTFITICKNEHPNDYQIMEKWVNNLK
jgi:hypothetical protein